MKRGVCLFAIVLPVWLFGQTARIDRLRAELPMLKDSARIDSMNVLSGQFFQLSMKDQAEGYAASAYGEAGALRYFHGMAAALSRQAAMRTFFYSDFAGGERLNRAALGWYQKTGNKAGLAATYGQLSFVCFAQTQYDEALRYSDKSFALCKQSRDTSGMLSALELNTQVYLKRGEFDWGFNAAQLALQISTRLGDSVEIKSVLLGLGTLCMAIEDYPLALNYYRAVFQHFTKEDSVSLLKSEDLVWAKMEFAEIYSHLKEFDSAL